jgi:hypothetical protein
MAGGATVLRQSPGHSARWGNVIFDFDATSDRYDWWFVCHSTGLSYSETTICDPENVVYCSMEPKDWVSSAFLSQFPKIISADPEHVDAGAKPFNVSTWWVGVDRAGSSGNNSAPGYRLDYDSLARLNYPKKTDRISVVASGKRVLPGHERRFRFLRRLESHPVGKFIDFFGTGFRPIADKWDAIWPYAHHVTIENSAIPDYWSEKLGDSLLGYSLPLYYGCTNIEDYFPADSVISMDITNFTGATKAVERALDEGVTSDQIQAMGVARERILNEFNFLSFLAGYADQPGHRFEEVMLHPSSNLPRPGIQRATAFAARQFGRLAVAGQDLAASRGAR